MPPWRLAERQEGPVAGRRSPPKQRIADGRGGPGTRVLGRGEAGGHARKKLLLRPDRDRSGSGTRSRCPADGQPPRSTLRAYGTGVRHRARRRPAVCPRRRRTSIHLRHRSLRLAHAESARETARFRSRWTCRRSSARWSARCVGLDAGRRHADRDAHDQRALRRRHDERSWTSSRSRPRRRSSPRSRSTRSWPRTAALRCTSTRRCTTRTSTPSRSRSSTGHWGTGSSRSRVGELRQRGTAAS